MEDLYPFKKYYTACTKMNIYFVHEMRKKMFQLYCFELSFPWVFQIISVWDMYTYI